MTSRRVRIGAITHSWARSWGKDEQGCIQRRTRCGILYARQQVKSTNAFVDCMTCLVLEIHQ